MIRSLRSSVAPLLLLLAVEVGTIVALQALGTTPGMQIPWSRFGDWLNSNPIEVLVPPLVRVTALAVAYWMFLSTSLFVVAQLSRIPAAIRATSLVTLPSVRRVVDGAMVVGLATTAVMGTSSAAFAAPQQAPANSDDAVSTINNGGRITLGPASTPAQTGNAAPSQSAEAAPSSTTSSSTTSSSTTSSTTTSSSVAPTTSAPTTAAPTTSTTAPSVARPKLPSGDGWVGTPRPGAPLPGGASAQQAPSVTTPSVPAPSPGAGQTTGTSVLGASEHIVVRGDNLWTISRNALIDSGTASPTEAQIRTYWLKVIEANRANLKSGDPHWIFPGEIVKLPPRA